MIGLAVACLVWAGMVLGISFLETPVKFTAPSVTLSIGLDVGRHVFGVFNKVEIVVALVCVALLAVSRPTLAVGTPLAVVGLIVALQTLWLLPVLDRRVGLILAGQTPPSAPYHYIYVGLELLKVTCLLTAGVACLLALKHPMPPNSAIKGL